MIVVDTGVLLAAADADDADHDPDTPPEWVARMIVFRVNFDFCHK